MDLQAFVENMAGLASVYAFDVLPDGSYSVLRMMAANKAFLGSLRHNPNAPEFYPGIPYTMYWQDSNFELFCYRCGSSGQPLYSYVYAHGHWMSGHYLPLQSDKEGTFYCCYVLKFSGEAQSENMTQHSPEISSAVLNISIKLHKTRDFGRAMSETAAELQKICGAEKCCIMLVDRNEKACTLYNESGEIKEYLDYLAEDMGRTPFEVAECWERDLAHSDCLLLDDLSLVKERDPVWYESLKKNDIRSIVLYNVKFNGDLVGFIWAADFAVNDILRIKETLELTTFFIAAVIANHQLLGKLEVMSMMDMLTEVSNRNAMNKRLRQMADSGRKPPLGIVFADINGLKAANDTLGHTAGDALLRNAARLLRKVFSEHEIYRAGGDEFVVLCPDITETELAERIKKLHEAQENYEPEDGPFSETPKVSLAVGTGYFQGDYDIYHAMQLTDQRMYSDKEEYYRRKNAQA